MLYEIVCCICMLDANEIKSKKKCKVLNKYERTTYNLTHFLKVDRWPTVCPKHKTKIVFQSIPKLTLHVSSKCLPCPNDSKLKYNLRPHIFNRLMRLMHLTRAKCQNTALGRRPRYKQNGRASIVIYQTRH